MERRLESFLVFVASFTASMVSIAYYRYQTVFAKLCEQMAEEQLPGPSMSVAAECLGFDQVLIVTAISPLYFLLSVTVGISAVVLVWKIK